MQEKNAAKVNNLFFSTHTRTRQEEVHNKLPEESEFEIDILIGECIGIVNWPINRNTYYL